MRLFYSFSHIYQIFDCHGGVPAVFYDAAILAMTFKTDYLLPLAI